MLWWHWSILGFSLVGIEILTLGGLGNFYFLFFGTAALMVSGLTWAGIVEAAWLQWFLFAILGFLSLLVMKKPLQNKGNLGGNDETLVDSMLGEMAKTLEPIQPMRTGKVELRGSTWTAHNAGNHLLEKDSIAKIVRVDGLTLWIQAESPTQEDTYVG